MTIGQAINRLIEEWEASKKSEYVRKPVAYALFHTWKWADAYEKERQKKAVKRGRPEGKKCKDCRYVMKAIYLKQKEPYTKELKMLRQLSNHTRQKVRIENEVN